MTPDTNGRQRRAGLIAAGAVALALGALALAGGAALLGLNESKRDAAGFYGTGTGQLSTPTSAIVADDIDLDAGGSDWLFDEAALGSARVSATGTDEEPVFVGVAPADRVGAYLRGVAHDLVDDVDVDPLTVTYDRRHGTAATTAPGDQGFWTHQASGSGRQTVTWDLEQGTWAVVVMNADGSPGVSTGVAVGASTDALAWAGGVLLVLGIGLAGGGGAALYAGRGRRRPLDPAPAPA